MFWDKLTVCFLLLFGYLFLVTIIIHYRLGLNRSKKKHIQINFLNPLNIIINRFIDFLRILLFFIIKYPTAFLLIVFNFIPVFGYAIYSWSPLGLIILFSWECIILVFFMNLKITLFSKKTIINILGKKPLILNKRIGKKLRLYGSSVSRFYKFVVSLQFKIYHLFIFNFLSFWFLIVGMTFINLVLDRKNDLNGDYFITYIIVLCLQHLISFFINFFHKKEYKKETFFVTNVRTNLKRIAVLPIMGWVIGMIFAPLLSNTENAFNLEFSMIFLFVFIKLSIELYLHILSHRTNENSLVNSWNNYVRK